MSLKNYIFPDYFADIDPFIAELEREFGEKLDEIAEKALRRIEKVAQAFVDTTEMVLVPRLRNTEMTFHEAVGAAPEDVANWRAGINKFAKPTSELAEEEAWIAELTEAESKEIDHG